MATFQKNSQKNSIYFCNWDIADEKKIIEIFVKNYEKKTKKNLSEMSSPSFFFTGILLLGQIVEIPKHKTI